jgi:hypothetical protein
MYHPHTFTVRHTSGIKVCISHIMPGNPIFSQYNTQCPSRLTGRVSRSCDGEKLKLSSEGGGDSASKKWKCKPQWAAAVTLPGRCPPLVMQGMIYGGNLTPQLFTICYAEDDLRRKPDSTADHHLLCRGWSTAETWLHCWPPLVKKGMIYGGNLTPPLTTICYVAYSIGS